MLFSGQGLDETEEGAVQALPTAKATLRNMSPVQQPMSLEGLWLKLHALILRPASQQLARDSISLSAFRVILCRKDRPEQWLSILQASHDYPQPLAYPFGYLELVNGSDAEGPFSELFEVKSRRLLPNTRHSLFCMTIRRCCLMTKKHRDTNIATLWPCCFVVMTSNSQLIVCCECCLQAEGQRVTVAL